MAYDETLAGRVRKRLAERRGFSERKMFGGLCFLLNGHMCCGVNGRDLMVRVGPDAYEASLRRPGARPMDFTGRPLRGMVYVAPDAVASSRALERWLDRATAFAEGLPPRPRTRKAGAARARRRASR